MAAPAKTTGAPVKRKGRKQGSKRYRAALKKVDTEKNYPLAEAVKILKSFAPTKFDETVDVAIHLGIDAKKTDQLIRGAVALPKGLGKTIRVVVFAEGEKAREAKDAGADVVGSDDLVKKISDGWTEFDLVLASPDMMKHVGRLGKVLGPQGKMPSTKTGTVTPDVGQAVKEFKAGKVEYRTDAGGNVQAPIGKRSFSETDLFENANAFVQHIRNQKPSSARGAFLRRVVISSTMSPGVNVFIEQESE